MDPGGGILKGGIQPLVGTTRLQFPLKSEAGVRLQGMSRAG
jgi:hypothetical protein